MPFYRGEEGSVKFKNSSGTAALIAGTRNWSLTVNKELLECTDHGDSSRAYVGGLISATGSVELIYPGSAGDETLNFIEDCVVAEGVGEGVFELYTEGTKKLAFSGIITSTDFSAAVGDLQTVTVGFTANGNITSDV